MHNTSHTAEVCQGEYSLSLSELQLLQLDGIHILTSLSVPSGHKAAKWLKPVPQTFSAAEASAQARRSYFFQKQHLLKLSADCQPVPGHLENLESTENRGGGKGAEGKHIPQNSGLLSLLITQKLDRNLSIPCFLSLATFFVPQNRTYKVKDKYLKLDFATLWTNASIFTLFLVIHEKNKYKNSLFSCSHTSKKYQTDSLQQEKLFLTNSRRENKGDSSCLFLRFLGHFSLVATPPPSFS